MKAKIKIEKEVDIIVVSLNVNVRYEDDDIPYDFPGREGDQWRVKIGIDTGIIENWPIGFAYNIESMKVCDEGTYELIDSDGNIVASIDNNYVPNRLIPGEDGDYIEMDIDENGKIKNWPSKPSFSNFFKSD